MAHGILQNNPLYQSPPVGFIQASVWDLTSPDGLPPAMEPESADIVVLVFVLSALHPNEWARAIANIYKVLILSFTSRMAMNVSFELDTQTRRPRGFTRLRKIRPDSTALQRWSSAG
jgi:hypothetical protein